MSPNPTGGTRIYPLESSAGRFCEMPCAAVQGGTITGKIHGRFTRMEINQQQTLVVPKDCGHNFLREWHCFELVRGTDEGCLHDIDAFFVSDVT
ncbi:hypothetical protein AVEN_49113-1 [Araneus ventricosus]|uniref:Uncharacterized protein n=1 Tax=Araneus ventricosus TaxID=182803 RepID=A0A4Y2C1H9_ARAVE|nr:hypothetical protein AVEN_49113-1 [Araneus ventricosus]